MAAILHVQIVNLNRVTTFDSIAITIMAVVYVMAVLMVSPLLLIHGCIHTPLLYACDINKADTTMETYSCSMNRDWLAEGVNNTFTLCCGPAPPDQPYIVIKGWRNGDSLLGECVFYTPTIKIYPPVHCTLMEGQVVNCVTTPKAANSQTAPPETTPPETTSPEATPPETTSPEATPPGTTPPETTSPEATPSETTSPEATPPETTSPEVTPVGTTMETSVVALLVMALVLPLLLVAVLLVVRWWRRRRPQQYRVRNDLSIFSITDDDSEEVQMDELAPSNEIVPSNPSPTSSKASEEVQMDELAPSNELVPSNPSPTSSKASDDANVKLEMEEEEEEEDVFQDSKQRLLPPSSTSSSEVSISSPERVTEVEVEVERRYFLRSMV